MEQEFRQIVKTAAEITKVAWGNPPANSPFPYISIFPITDAGDQTMDGRVTSGRQANVQVDVWHSDFAALVALKNKVMGLDCFVGDGLVSNILHNSTRYGTDTTSAGNPVYRYSIDFKITYRE